MKKHLYEFVGNPEILKNYHPDYAGQKIETIADLIAISRESHDDIFTFIIDQEVNLYLSERRNEHVYCATCRPVLSAGEIGFFIDGKNVICEFVSNLSTGYCPEIQSFVYVKQALDTLAIEAPAQFTHGFKFAKCASCKTVNVFKGDNHCAVCGNLLDFDT